MIVRELPDGATAVMSQTDHSRFVGECAAHWGNDTFARPRPYDSVVRGAIYHDFGWLAVETNPPLNGETGKPYQFFETPFDPAQLTAYQECIDWLGGLDPYAGVLIGKHRTGLWQGRYGSLRKPAMQYSATGPGPRPEIKAFIARNETAQGELARAFDPAELQVNYRLLQVWDHLGLYFCCRPPREDAVDPVPTSYATPDGEGVEVTLHPLGDFEVEMTPFPFDVHPIQLPIVYKRLPSGVTYPHQQAWLQAYFSAPPAIMTYTIR